MNDVTVRHTFEAAHRLPHLGGRCRSLHGHSWQVAVTITAPTLSEDATVAELGQFKAVMREWIDHHLDHGTMLGIDDTLLSPLLDAACAVYVFGHDWEGQAWPTVEAVAALLAEQAAAWLGAVTPRTPGARITRVHVAATASTSAAFTPAWETG